MNNFGFKSYNSWDKLTKVMVGNVFPKGFFEDYQDKKVADVMTKVNEETREDLDYFCKVLTENYGVEVYRMPDACVTYNKRYESVTEFVEEEGYIPRPFNTPRDDQIIFGEQCLIGKKDAIFRKWNKTIKDNHNIFREDEYAPWAGCDDFLDLADENQELNIIKEATALNPNKGFAISWPSIMRTGRDIMIDLHDFNGPTKVLVDWFKKFNEKYDYNFRINTTIMGGHTDAVLALVRPGLLISHTNVNKYEETYPGWDVIKINRKHNDHTTAWQDYRVAVKDDWRLNKKRPVADYWIAGEEQNEALHKFIDLYMHPSVGACWETNFDVNCLSVNENTVIASGPAKELEDRLGEHKVDVVTCNMRHRFFWDGGLHCATSDLEREGECEDYFPERGEQGVEFGRLWGNNELRR